MTLAVRGALGHSLHVGSSLFRVNCQGGLRKHAAKHGCCLKVTSGRVSLHQAPDHSGQGLENLGLNTSVFLSKVASIVLAVV